MATGALLEVMRQDELRLVHSSERGSGIELLLLLTMNVVRGDVERMLMPLSITIKSQQ